jgi:hypothetical protein
MILNQVVFSTLMAYLLLTTTGLRQFETSGEDEWSALDVWRNATLAFLYSAFLEVILVNVVFVSLFLCQNFPKTGQRTNYGSPIFLNWSVKFF